MEFNKKVQIALGEMFKDVKLDKVTTPKKVELGSIDELKSQVKIVDNTFEELTKLHTDFIKAIDSLDKQAEEVRRLHSDAEKIADKAFFALDDFEKKAKDLGVDFKTKEYNELDQAVRSVINKVESGYEILKGRK
tara:strand:- start:21232 stop:21636 length:405 start_codon:yes stop_codon:yes gene_type:complete